MPKQITLDKTFLEIATTISKLSNCIVYQVGAIIVQNQRIISTGYNGTATKCPNCDELFSKNKYDRQKHHTFSTKNEIHAEMNAVLSAAKYGTSLEGATIYCTLQPCSQCLKNICATGIKRVVYIHDYEYSLYDEATFEMLKNSGIELKKID